MTDEQLDSIGEAMNAAEQEQLETSRELEVERMAQGLCCYECGAEHEIPTGRPTLCDVCRGRTARFTEIIETAERRLERRRQQQAAGEQACDVEGCSDDPEAYPDSCCDACLFAYWLRAQRAAAEPMVNAWTTADGRYFANERDAQLQQRWLAEKRQRHADRIAAYVRRRGAWTDQAEQHFLEQRFSITPEGERALRDAVLAERASKQANTDAERAMVNTARMFDAIAASFPSLRSPTPTEAA
jgi:hypothetical protein